MGPGDSGMHRRDAIRGLAGAGILASSGTRAAGQAASGDGSVASDIVRFGPAVEPLVRLIEDVPREECIETLASRLRSGLPYRRLLAALFLAGIRNVNPQPPGFKLHCVFVLHAAHELSLEASAEGRLLPLFWALDNFKKAQLEDVEQGDFRLRKVTGRLPGPTQAWSDFHTAMETWDAPRADRAIAVLARTRGAHEVMAGLWRHGARDYRNIGHKAIFTASTWRTLQTIGWRHAEPALRSLTLGLLDFGKSVRMNGFGFDDQCHFPNAELARKALPDLPAGWVRQGAPTAGPAKDIVASIREAGHAPACTSTVRMIARGEARSADVWDGIHLAAGELMLRLPGILGVHCVTSANALHYAFRMSSDAETRLYLVLQGVGWMAQFASFMSADDEIRDFDIGAMAAEDVAMDSEDGAAEILGDLASSPDRAARKAYAYAQNHSDASPLLQAARELVCRKTDEVHHLKVAAAVFEDLELVHPRWRPHMLATAAHYLRGTEHPDSKIAQRARDALGYA